MPSLHLRVSCRDTVPGEAVAAIGSWSAWDKHRPAVLSTTANTFPKWTASVPLPTSASVEYKYVIIRDGHVIRWEKGPKGVNREVALEDADASTDDIFDRIPAVRTAYIPKDPPSAPQSRPWASNGISANGHSKFPAALDDVERAIVRLTNEKRSWRQRLSFVRSLFTEDSAASETSFSPQNIDHLATVSVFLTFLASGQLRCEEDGGHHRPNHHANEARQLEAALARVAKKAPRKGTDSYIPYVIRKIFPQLPSYAPQFTASVPLTRIRDIAHRGDIPHDFKQEIKHTLQNKLHRCAGPEDLQTSARLLERIQNGDFSGGLKEQFAIFHAELLEFFNASSLDDRLRYLQGNQNTKALASLAGKMLKEKHGKYPAMPQLETLTSLRKRLAELPLMHIDMETAGENQLPSEDVQRTRLADIDLEGYAFMLLAGIAKDAEQQTEDRFDWNNAVKGLSLSLENIALSGVCPAEARATANELNSIANPAKRRDLLRTKATVDRALRFAEDFSSSLSDVFSRRATSIGQALGVDGHAVTVFAEAEIRSNITFQASRIADACTKMCRIGLNLPPWDPLYAGEAFGKLVFAEHLSDVSATEDSVIAVCRYADGDEDIPSNVCAVVLGRSLPHLSHLGVRARQAGVIFVCAEEREAFEKFWSDRSLSYAAVEVSHREGLKSFARTHSIDGSKDSNKSVTENGHNVKKAVKIAFDGSVKNPIAITEATRDNASSKCAFVGKLRKLAMKSDRLFEAPNGVALPHGIFQSQRSSCGTAYLSLIRQYLDEGNTEKHDDAAHSLFSFIATNFEMTNDHCKRVQAEFSKSARVMVRSSANAEDLEDMSGAGLYDSIANVQVDSTDALKSAVARVWASLWTSRAASSRGSYGVPHDEVSMAVLIQEMISAEFSFVGFSYDPVRKSSEAIYIEVAVGMGETLASASSLGSPYRFRVDRKSLDVEVLSFASYSEGLVPSDDSDGLHAQTVDYSTQQMTINMEFRTEVVQKIAKTIVLLEKEFGGPQDVEGAITADDTANQIYIVQARPQIL